MKEVATLHNLQTQVPEREGEREREREREKERDKPSFNSAKLPLHSTIEGALLRQAEDPAFRGQRPKSLEAGIRSMIPECCRLGMPHVHCAVFMPGCTSRPTTTTNLENRQIDRQIDRQTDR